MLPFVAVAVLLGAAIPAGADTGINVTATAGHLTGNIRWDSVYKFTVTTSTLADTACDKKSVSWQIYIETYIGKYSWAGSDRANSGGCGSSATWGAFSGEDFKGCGIWRITAYLYAAGSTVNSATYYNPIKGPGSARCQEG